MLQFTVKALVLTPEVETLLKTEEQKVTFSELLLRHSRGEAGDLSNAQALRTSTIMFSWDREGEKRSASAVRSVMPLDGIPLYFFSCMSITRVSLVEAGQYRGKYALDFSNVEHGQK